MSCELMIIFRNYLVQELNRSVIEEEVFICLHMQLACYKSAILYFFVAVYSNVCVECCLCILYEDLRHIIKII